MDGTAIDARNRHMRHLSYFSRMRKAIATGWMGSCFRKSGSIASPS